MINHRNRKKKLSREILGLLAVSFCIGAGLMWVLSLFGIGIMENILFARDIELTDAQLKSMDAWIFVGSFFVSVLFFMVLFLFLLGDRLSYIRDILRGIEALHTGEQDYVIPLEGNNELTQLAEAVNYLSRTQQEVKAQELALQEEKEQLVRSLSHDIRTPLTSISSYSELLLSQVCSEEEQRAHLRLIHKKAGQIRELTDILLDGGQRNPEHFEDARLLMAQLAEEFTELLEEDFSVSTDLSGCHAFSGTFDVGELQRIFDNLISNVQKYADRTKPVLLQICREGASLLIRQENYIENNVKSDGYQIGLKSIRRIAQNYGGRVEVLQEGDLFSISITLSEI